MRPGSANVAKLELVRGESSMQFRLSAESPIKSSTMTAWITVDSDTKPRRLKATRVDSVWTLHSLPASEAFTVILDPGRAYEPKQLGPFEPMHGQRDLGTVAVNRGSTLRVSVRHSESKRQPAVLVEVLLKIHGSTITRWAWAESGASGDIVVRGLPSGTHRAFVKPGHIPPNAFATSSAGASKRPDPIIRDVDIPIDGEGVLDVTLR